MKKDYSKFGVWNINWWFYCKFINALGDLQWPSARGASLYMNWYFTFVVAALPSCSKVNDNAYVPESDRPMPASSPVSLVHTFRNHNNSTHSVNYLDLWNWLTTNIKINFILLQSPLMSEIRIRVCIHTWPFPLHYFRIRRWSHEQNNLVMTVNVLLKKLFDCSSFIWPIFVVMFIIFRKRELESAHRVKLANRQ